jgi:hypothetical protein
MANQKRVKRNKPSQTKTLDLLNVVRNNESVLFLTFDPANSNARKAYKASLLIADKAFNELHMSKPIEPRPIELTLTGHNVVAGYKLLEPSALGETESQRERRLSLQRSLVNEGKPCAICESRCTYAGQFLDDVLEFVILAEGPNHLVAKDTHGLGHYGCVTGLIEQGDIQQA